MVFCIRHGKDWSLSGILPCLKPVPGSTGKNRSKYKNAVLSQPSGYFLWKFPTWGIWWSDRISRESDIWSLKRGHITTSSYKGGSPIIRWEIAWRFIIWHLKCNMTPLGCLGLILQFSYHIRHTRPKYRYMRCKLSYFVIWPARPI